MSLEFQLINSPCRFDYMRGMDAQKIECERAVSLLPFVEYLEEEMEGLRYCSCQRELLDALRKVKRMLREIKDVYR